MTSTMRAIVIERAGGPEMLRIRENWPKPMPENGRVLIRVMAFGLNRGELFTRLGYSPGVEFPRVLGIECVGIVESAPGTSFEKGQSVVATTGGMGRSYDGSYAEFVSVPAPHVHKVETNLEWVQLASVPEAFHTASGALFSSLEIKSGQSLLIRGGSSSVGLVAANIAKECGVSVSSTTRDESKSDLLGRFGAEHVVIDNGKIASNVKQIAPDGVDALLDLVGTNVIEDSFACVRRGGVLCIAGLLGGEWEITNFAPGSAIPSTTKLTYFSSSSTPLSKEALKAYLTGLEDTKYCIPLDRVFEFEEISEAHRYMESNSAAGKIVIKAV